MGILNVTPDSFSDGGRWLDIDAAVAHALRMVDDGADVIDVGGESTRPGAEAVGDDEQIARVVPVIERVRRALDGRGSEAVISIDTMSPRVAEAALDAGAAIINDVAGGRFGTIEVAAERQAPIVLMHMAGEPKTMQDAPHYDDVVSEVRAYLVERAEAAVAAGVPRGQVVIDPGIGFGKTREHNLTLLANLDHFVATGYPVLLGTSRKRFMGSICVDANGDPPRPDTLVGATCATTALGVAAGVAMFRVHDVLANRQSADVAHALRQTS